MVHLKMSTKWYTHFSDFSVLNNLCHWMMRAITICISMSICMCRFKGMALTSKAHSNWVYHYMSTGFSIEKSLYSIDLFNMHLCGQSGTFIFMLMRCIYTDSHFVIPQYVLKVTFTLLLLHHALPTPTVFIYLSFHLYKFFLHTRPLFSTDTRDLLLKLFFTSQTLCMGNSSVVLL